jgi:hypothetical protein
VSQKKANRKEEDKKVFTKGSVTIKMPVVENCWFTGSIRMNIRSTCKIDRGPEGPSRQMGNQNGIIMVMEPIVLVPKLQISRKYGTL